MLLYTSTKTCVTLQAFAKILATSYGTCNTWLSCDYLMTLYYYRLIASLKCFADLRKSCHTETIWLNERLTRSLQTFCGGSVMSSCRTRLKLNRVHVLGLLLQKLWPMAITQLDIQPWHLLGDQKRCSTETSVISSCRVCSTHRFSLSPYIAVF